MKTFAMWRFVGWARSSIILVVLFTAPSARAEVTLESLLSEMIDYSAVAHWPQPEFSCRQASSYDRATVAPDKPGWFANRDQNQFIRIETNQGRTEKELAAGGGAGLDLPPGPAAVRRLELRVPAGKLASPQRTLRSLVLRMDCDVEATIWCPVSNFFGLDCVIMENAQPPAPFELKQDGPTGFVCSLRRTGDVDRVEFIRRGSSLGAVRLRLRRAGGTWHEVSQSTSGVEQGQPVKVELPLDAGQAASVRLDPFLPN